MPVDRAAARTLLDYNERVGHQRSTEIREYIFGAILFNLCAPILIILAGIAFGIRMFKL